ncbi:multicystatin-like [Solanum lycopersicum]
MANVGGLVDVPFQNKVEFDDLARFAVKDYNQKNGSSLEFEKVLKVKKQIVAGIMYYITFEGTEGGKKKEYEAKIWVKESENFKKVVGFKLVGDDRTKPGGIINVPNPNSNEFQELARFAVQDYNEKQKTHLEFVENLNVKEQVVAGMMYYITLAATDAGIKKIYEAKIWVKEWENFKKVVEFKLSGDDITKPGGIISVPFPNKPEFQKLARFAIQDYNEKEKAHLEFVENLNVKEQVVAGMMYYITLAATDAGKKKIYETKIWVKEWEDFKKVVEFKLVGDNSAKVGGIIDVPNPNNPEFQDLARFAVNDYNKSQNAHLEFVEVLNVKEQVVSGMMYYITLVATDDGNKKDYEAKIWVKEWEDFKKVISFKLVGKDSAIIGGFTDVPFPNKREFQDLTRFAIQDYNKKENAHLEFVENLNVKKQVVAGMLYYITFAATDAGKKNIYETKIWVKEWEDFKKVVEFKLVGDDGAKLGGIINVPFPNSPEFQDLARFAVQDYNNKEKAHLEFVEVLNVKEQVVAGMMYYITLAVTDAGKKKIYEANIWVKEWEHFIKVVEFKPVSDDSVKTGDIVDVPDPNIPPLQDLARFAVQDYNKAQNAHLEYVENLNVKEQLVAGTLYYITLVATDAGKKKIYETKIWVKEWEDFKKVVEFKLVGDDSPNPGGITNVPFPNLPQFKDLARFAVQDYNKKENAHLEFVENLNVKEQVVAGIIYYITLVATDAGKKKIYETKILVKGWENFKEVQEFKLVGDATK